MINWAQDLICNVLMKMKRGRRVELEERKGGWQGTLMKLEDEQLC